MKITTPCPASEELRQLLTGALSDDRTQSYVEHLGECAGCQSKLENLATEGTNLSQIVEQLRDTEPDATSAYWPALNALDVAARPTPAPAPASRDSSVSLQFLQPASDSAYLGRMAHFDVMRVLGRGGMGIVLEAFDSRLRRNVALKVLHPDLAHDDLARQRFCREARAAASITHENVVAVHQVEKSSGDGDGLPYMVMQLVAGESLDKRLTRDKRLPFREIVRIGMQAAQGLAAAHAQGLIHRDIKPGNILLETPHDRVKLSDFGLVKAVEDARLTVTGLVAGTPLYMAPEQALGGEADPRSDLFSLGAVLYEMCAGQPPFGGNSALAILKQITEVKQRPLRELNPALPEWLGEMVDRLLAKKPEDRIQSAAHLAELLEFQWALMKTTSDEVPTVCRIEQAKRTRRNRTIAAVIGATFLAAGLLGGMWLSRHSGTLPSEASSSSAEPTAVLAANSGAVWSVSFDPTSDMLAMAVEDGTVRLWDVPTKSVKATIGAHRGNIWVSRYSPDGSLLATAGDDGVIHLFKPSEPDPIRTFEHPNAIRALVFSSDGTKLFGGDRAGNLRVWPVDGEEPLLERQHRGAVYAVAVSADDEILATAGSDKVIQLWSTKSLTPRLPLEGHAGPVYGLAFRKDGQLASAGWDKKIRIWDTANGMLVKSWEGHDGDIWGVAYSPDGNKLVTGGTDGAVKLWNAETGQLLATYLGHHTGVHTVAFNHDGTQIASGGRDGAVRIWKVE